MKMKYNYLLAVLLGTASLSACSAGEDTTNTSAELVPVTLQLPGIYNGISSRASTNDELAGITIYNLSVGSTLWLFSQENGSNTPTIQGYLVRNSGGGAQSLYPCGTTTDNDSIRIDTTKVSNVPLYLKQNTTYTFRAISPALPMSSYSHTFTFKDGDYAVATNDNWTETESTTMTVTGNEGIVVLKPMMQIGARMTFTINRGANISSVSVIQSGVEVDGLGDNSVSYSVGDNLVGAVGNPYHRFFVGPAKFTKTSSEGLTADRGIIPVDCRSTSVFIILNLMVNGVPVQYSYAVKDRNFIAGHSYNYNITLSLKDNITVANWQENSWSYDIN